MLKVNRYVGVKECEREQGRGGREIRNQHSTPGNCCSNETMFETVSFAKCDPAFARLNPSIDSGAIYGYQSETLGKFQGFISSDTKCTFNSLTAST